MAGEPQGSSSPIDQRESGEQSEATGAAAMAHQRWMARAGENGTIPPNALMLAKKQAEAVPVLTRDKTEGSVADAGIWNWEWLGPGNIGGRIRAIAMHPIPGTMFVGAASGGLWRTFDRGNSWEPVDDFMASLAVTSIVVDPTNTLTIYAGTGEGVFGGNVFAPPGAGIFISTDLGTTWGQLPSTAPTNPDPRRDPWGYVNRLAHHPTRTGVLFAATRNGGVLRSAPIDPNDINVGLTWTQVLLLSTPCGPADGCCAASCTPVNDPDCPGGNLCTTNMTDVEIDPNNASRIFVGTGNGVWMSTNDGDAGTWVRQTTGAANKLPTGVGRCELDFGSGGVIWVSINRNNGEIWNSTNNGATWNPINTGSNYLCDVRVVPLRCQGNYDNTIWASPDDPNLIVVGGIDLFRSSTDGNFTLSSISNWRRYHNGGPADSAHADQHLIIEPPNYGPGNRKVYFANDGGIQSVNNIYTVTANSGWINLANDLGITQFYGGAAAPDGSIMLGGSQDNDQSRYRPIDGAQAWLQPSTGDGGYAAVDYDDPTTLYGERTSLTIRKSTDGGQNFTLATAGLADARSNCNCTNRSLFIAPFVMDPSDPTILVAGGRSIWRTTDGADSWSAVRTAATGNCSVDNSVCSGGDCPIPQRCVFGSANSQCSAIDIAKTKSNRIWVGYSDGRLSRTTTSTRTWDDIDEAAFDRDADGIFEDLDLDGVVEDPLPNRWVTDIAISPFDSNEVFVTLGGYNNNSIWFTRNGGANWSLRQGTGTNIVPSIHVSTIRFHPLNRNWVYVGTDLGVFASEDKGLNWNRTSRFSSATPNPHDGPVNVEISELFWQGDNLVAATFGRGMYKTRPLDGVVVNWRNSTGIEDGSLVHPFDTVQEGISAAGHGTDMVIASGTYDEAGTTTFFKRGIVTAPLGSVVIR